MNGKNFLGIFFALALFFSAMALTIPSVSLYTEKTVFFEDETIDLSLRNSMEEPITYTILNSCSFSYVDLLKKTEKGFQKVGFIDLLCYRPNETKELEGGQKATIISFKPRTPYFDGYHPISGTYKFSLDYSINGAAYTVESNEFEIVTPDSGQALTLISSKSSYGPAEPIELEIKNKFDKKIFFYNLFSHCSNVYDYVQLFKKNGNTFEKVVIGGPECLAYPSAQELGVGQTAKISFTTETGGLEDGIYKIITQYAFDAEINETFATGFGKLKEPVDSIESNEFEIMENSIPIPIPLPYEPPIKIFPLPSESVEFSLSVGKSKEISIGEQKVTIVLSGIEETVKEKCIDAIPEGHESSVSPNIPPEELDQVICLPVKPQKNATIGIKSSVDDPKTITPYSSYTIGLGERIRAFGITITLVKITDESAVFLADTGEYTRVIRPQSLTEKISPVVIGQEGQTKISVYPLKTIEITEQEVSEIFEVTKDIENTTSNAIRIRSVHISPFTSEISAEIETSDGIVIQKISGELNPVITFIATVEQFVETSLFPKPVFQPTAITQTASAPATESAGTQRAKATDSVSSVQSTVQIIPDTVNKKIVLEENGAIAVTENEIELNGKIFVKNENQKHELKVLPKKALQEVNETAAMSQSQTTLKITSDKAVYSAEETKKGKLLGIIDAEYSVLASVDAETGQTEVNQPFWSFLVFN